LLRYYWSPPEELFKGKNSELQSWVRAKEDARRKGEGLHKRIGPRVVYAGFDTYDEMNKLANMRVCDAMYFINIKNAAIW
jgi:hypothetical protein